MNKRILVVPDVHGRIFWKESVNKYINLVDKIVFLGDYLDPYGGEEGLADDIYQNMMDIIKLKMNHMDKVVLLKGNHDQHYASERFEELAGGTRMDLQNWNKYHETFNTYKLVKVNDIMWNLPDNRISLADPEIIERINLLDDDGEGQDLLAVVGMNRSWNGEETGGVLWADVEEHAIPYAPKVYDLNKVFQVFGHTKLSIGYDKIEYDNFAMIDSRQCFIIDEGIQEKIISVREYEKERQKPI